MEINAKDSKGMSIKISFATGKKSVNSKRCYINGCTCNHNSVNTIRTGDQYCIDCKHNVRVG